MMREKAENLPKTATRDAILESGAVNEDTRTVTLSFASEKPVNRWYGAEVLQIDENSINAQRINDGLCCMLYNHDRDKVIGKVTRYWIEDNKAKAEVQFDVDEKSNEIFSKVKSGMIRGVSVGYAVQNWEEVEAGSVSTSGRVKGPAYVAIRWEVCEISIVSVPADSDVGVGRSLKDDNLQNKGALNMEDKNIVQTKTQDDTAIKHEAALEERQRIHAITNLCRAFNIEDNEINHYIDENMVIRDVEHLILNNLKKRQTPLNTVKTEVTADEFDKFRNAATDALLLREGVNLDKPAAGADELRGASLRDFLIKCAEHDGYTDSRFKETDILIRLAMTGTGALPGILSNAANKSLARAYDIASTTFQVWTAKGSNKDFKTATRYRLSEAGDLVPIKENGEFTYDELTEESAQARVLTFGRAWSLTREAIINDDLGALSTIPTKYAISARYGINKLVYETLAKTTDLFTAKNANLGTAAELSVASLGEARKLMRNQKNVGNKQTLNLTPKYLIIPSSLETKAQQLLHSTADPAGNNSGVVNPFANSLTIVCDAELDQYSETAWYLAADPLLAGGIEVTYLNGKDSPTIDSQVAFNRLGMDFRIYMDYGVNVVDYRGLVKNAGK